MTEAWRYITKDWAWVVASYVIGNIGAVIYTGSLVIPESISEVAVPMAISFVVFRVLDGRGDGH